MLSLGRNMVKWNPLDCCLSQYQVQFRNTNTCGKPSVKNKLSPTDLVVNHVDEFDGATAHNRTFFGVCHDDDCWYNSVSYATSVRLVSKLFQWQTFPNVTRCKLCQTQNQFGENINGRIFFIANENEYGTLHTGLCLTWPPKLRVSAGSNQREGELYIFEYFFGGK